MAAAYDASHENADVNDRVELNDNGGVKVHGAVNDDVDVKVNVAM